GHVVRASAAATHIRLDERQQLEPGDRTQELARLVLDLLAWRRWQGSSYVARTRIAPGRATRPTAARYSVASRTRDAKRSARARAPSRRSYRRMPRASHIR